VRESPEYAFKLAQMAAGQLNIAPVLATAPVPVVAQAAPAHRALTQVRPAAGGNMSGAAPATARADLLASMDKWTPEQWDAYNARL
jgi:hypothetical protein